MQISLSLARKAVFGTAAVAAALMLGACGGGSGGDDKLIHAQFKIDSVTQDGVCEHVSVQATPKNLAPGQGSMSATKMFYTEIDMKQVKEGERIIESSARVLSLSLNTHLKLHHEVGGKTNND